MVQKFIDTRLANTEGHIAAHGAVKEWMFAGVLCHQCEVKLNVTEIMTKTAEADRRSAHDQAGPVSGAGDRLGHVDAGDGLRAG